MPFAESSPVHIVKSVVVSHEHLSINCVDFHRAGHVFATGGDDSFVRFWSTSVLFPASETTRIADDSQKGSGHSGSVNDLHFSREGILASVSAQEVILWTWISMQDDKSHGLWSKTKIIRNPSSNVADYFCVRWSPGDEFLAVGGLSNQVELYDTNSLQRIRVLDAPFPVKGIAWDPVGSFLGIQHSNGVAVWKISTWSPFDFNIEPYTQENGSELFLRLDWSPDGLYLLGVRAREPLSDGSFGSHIAFSHKRKDGFTESLKFVGHSEPVVVAKYSPRPLVKNMGQCVHLLALGSLDSNFSVWCLDSLIPIVIIQDIFSQAVTDLCWSGDGSILVAVSADGTLAAVHFDFSLFSPYYEGVMSEKVFLSKIASVFGGIVSDTVEKFRSTLARTRDTGSSSSSSESASFDRMEFYSSQNSTSSQNQSVVVGANGRRKLTPRVLLDHSDRSIVSNVVKSAPVTETRDPPTSTASEMDPPLKKLKSSQPGGSIRSPAEKKYKKRPILNSDDEADMEPEPSSIEKSTTLLADSHAGGRKITPRKISSADDAESRPQREGLTFTGQSSSVLSKLRSSIPSSQLCFPWKQEADFQFSFDRGCCVLRVENDIQELTSMLRFVSVDVPSRLAYSLCEKDLFNSSSAQARAQETSYEKNFSNCFVTCAAECTIFEPDSVSLQSNPISFSLRTQSPFCPRACGFVVVGFSDGSIRIFSKTGRLCVPPLIIASNPISYLASSESKRFLLACSSSGILRVWNTQSMEVVIDADCSCLLRRATASASDLSIDNFVLLESNSDTTPQVTVLALSTEHGEGYSYNAALKSWMLISIHSLSPTDAKHPSSLISERPMSEFLKNALESASVLSTVDNWIANHKRSYHLDLAISSPQDRAKHNHDVFELRLASLGFLSVSVQEVHNRVMDFVRFLLESDLRERLLEFMRELIFSEAGLMKPFYLKSLTRDDQRTMLNAVLVEISSHASFSEMYDELVEFRRAQVENILTL